MERKNTAKSSKEGVKSKIILWNKKVLLRDRKRRTGRGVSCPWRVLSGGMGYPLSWFWPGEGGIPVPGPSSPTKHVEPETGVPARPPPTSYFICGRQKKNYYSVYPYTCIKHFWKMHNSSVLGISLNLQAIRTSLPRNSNSDSNIWA